MGDSFAEMDIRTSLNSSSWENVFLICFKSRYRLRVLRYTGSEKFESIVSAPEVARSARSDRYSSVGKEIPGFPPSISSVPNEFIIKSWPRWWEKFYLRTRFTETQPRTFLRTLFIVIPARRPQSNFKTRFGATIALLKARVSEQKKKQKWSWRRCH